MSVGALMIKPVIFPTDLVPLYNNGKGESGRLPAGLLTAVGPQGQAHHEAARAFKALGFLCMGFSTPLPLTYTYGGTYRSYADQVTLFNQRYEYPAIPGRATKTWMGKRYSIRYGANGRPLAMAAVPGTSNHGWGLAFDFAFDGDVRDGIGPDDAHTITSHPQWDQFKAAALSCGFSWETTSEPWHMRLVTGGVNQRVLDVESFIAQLNAGTLPPAPAEPTPPPVVPVVPVVPSTPQPPVVTPAPTKNWTELLLDALPTLRVFDSGGQVVIMQQLLEAHLGPHPEMVPGSFDGATLNLLKWFQTAKGLVPDGFCGQGTWQRLIQA